MDEREKGKRLTKYLKLMREKVTVEVMREKREKERREYYSEGLWEEK